jgi:hypothetical protein
LVAQKAKATYRKQRLKTMDLFIESDAAFSTCRKYRYALWRIWDKQKPLVMFIGLNPSTASEDRPDPTIRSVRRISQNNGYGGFYMMNCFPFVSTDPQALRDFGNTAINDHWLFKISMLCKDIVFAWGNFKIVSDLNRDIELKKMFPVAYCLGKNSNGSPKHPLFLKGSTKLIKH